jgi:hypothetical protein
VKAFPRLASFAAFLCLIVLHLEWPDIERLRRPGGANAPPTGRIRGLSHGLPTDNREGAALTSPRIFSRGSLDLTAYFSI